MTKIHAKCITKDIYQKISSETEVAPPHKLLREVPPKVVFLARPPKQRTPHTHSPLVLRTQNVTSLVIHIARKGQI